MAWQDLLDSEILPGKPPKSSIFFRLRDNLVAVAQRRVGAPVVQVPVTVVLTGSGNWAIPDGVTAWEETLVGAGGGYVPAGPNATATTTTYNAVVVSAGGGAQKPGGSTVGGAGGVATGGDLNINGEAGTPSASLTAGLMLGGRAAQWSFPPLNTALTVAAGYGAGASAAGGGGFCIKRRVRVGGFPTVAYSVGVGGAGGGAPGILIIRY